MSNTDLNKRIEQAAEALWQSRETQTPIARISATYGIEGIENAYAVAAVNTRRRVVQGDRIVGKKVGLTSQSVQQQLGVDQPDFGILFGSMEYLDGEDVPMSRLIQPKAEAEIAFVVGRDLRSEKPSWSEFLSVLAYALPALEIVDSAIANWQLTLVDTVADNASCGLYVLGNQPQTIVQVSLADIGMQLTLNGQRVSVGTGAACLGHPLRAAYWMACMMASRGEGLMAGEVILSGALGPMVSIQQGDVLRAQIGGMGSVSCRIA